MALSTYEEFRKEWLSEIQEGNLTTVEKGRKFAVKIFSQWMDIENDNNYFIYCDGCNDGGIDIAYQKTEYGEDNEAISKIWYIVQSKYGAAFSGANTIRNEGFKVIETLEGRNHRLSNAVADLVDQIDLFKQTASDNDKIVLLFATVDPLTAEEVATLEDVRDMGRTFLGKYFDVEAISLRTIYMRLEDKYDEGLKNIISIRANLVSSGEDLLVGSAQLTNMYEFMRDFKRETADLEILYEKNVRQFLGLNKKVNRGIEKTLITEPERFGLYNNGITIVVEDYNKIDEDLFQLVNPFVVNGCQTTRTLWEVLYKRFNLTGSKSSVEVEEWKQRLQRAIVVLKIVKIGSNGNELLVNTTKYTNSQNSVSQKDFISLEQNFQTWARDMQYKYNVFLEVQRGAWDSYKAKLKKDPTIEPCDGYINAIDALKIYGAGWKGKPSIAFGKTPPFAPGGAIYKEIIERADFCTDDLYAAYLLKRITDYYKFGKSGIKHLGKARYMFYYIVVDLIKSCMPSSGMERSEGNITQCIINIFSKVDGNFAVMFYDATMNVLEKWFDRDCDECLYNEPLYDGDINMFLKADKLISRENIDGLYALISDEKRYLKQSHKDELFTLFESINYTDRTGRCVDSERSARMKLRVTMPDGTQIYERKVVDTLIETVKHIGVEAVARLCASSGERILWPNGVKLVTTKIDEKYGNRQHHLGRGWYIFTCTSTPVKKQEIEAIARALNIDIKVELV